MLTCVVGRQLVTPGTDGAELMDELKPSPHIKLNSKILLSNNFQQIGPMEWIMYKPRWGAFYNTELERHLQNLHVNTLVACGCNFPNCPRTTISFSFCGILELFLLLMLHLLSTTEHYKS